MSTFVDQAPAKADLSARRAEGLSGQPKIAVLVPCHNEEKTIGKVVRDFKRELPEAEIWVFDNCCTDGTVEIALEEGARVVAEPRKGKGFAVECMFDRINADFYVMVDGDDTYPAENVHALLQPVMSGEADMTVGARLEDFTDKSFRPLHVFGNNLVRGLINKIFSTKLTDILSGYRAWNGRVSRRLPIVSAGFEVETELTVQMLYHRLKIAEVQVPYRERPAGSVSKLRTFHDGFRVLWKIFSLFRSFKPLTFFGGVALMLFLAGLAAGIAPIKDYMTSGYVYRVPLAILATGLVLLSAGFAFLGVLLHAINFRFLEVMNVMTRRSSNIG